MNGINEGICLGVWRLWMVMVETFEVESLEWTMMDESFDVVQLGILDWI